MSRDQFFCGLLILAAANGLEGFVLNTVVTQGWSNALLSLFGVSAVVWIACFAASALLYDSRLDEVITTPDAVLGLGVLAITIFPFARFSWLALTALSLYIVCISPAGSSRRRGALIALAVTGPMLWGRILMEIFGPAILQTDAILVSTLIGTNHVGNVFSGAVESGGTSPQFAIYPPCSSLNGMSIAVLAFITISNTLGGAWSTKHLAWGLIAALSVFVVNVSRLSLIGLFPAYYSTIHGSLGNEIAAWFSLVLVVAISLFGIGREHFART
jgi:exosortase/archaeosortase family protein